MGYALLSPPSKYLLLHKKKPGSAIVESRLFSGYSASPLLLRKVGKSILGKGLKTEDKIFLNPLACL